MAIGVSDLETSNDGTDATSYTTASISPAANALIILVVHNSHGSAAELPSSVSGGGMTTWTQVDTQLNNISNRRVTLYRALESSPGSGTISINFTGTQTGCLWSVLEFTGVDTGGINGADAVVQSQKGNDALVTSFTVTLDSSFADAVNNMAFGAFGLNNIGTNPPTEIIEGSGFTQLSEIAHGLPNTAIFTEYKTGEDLTVDISWTTSARPAGIALEIGVDPGQVARPDGDISTGNWRAVYT